MIQNLKLNIPLIDEDLRSEVLEDTRNLEVVTEYSIADEDLHHGVTHSRQVTDDSTDLPDEFEQKW